MALFHSTAGSVPAIPDDLTVVQFMLDNAVEPPNRPERSQDNPCLIDEESGEAVSLADLRSRTDVLARALSVDYGLGDNDIVSLFIPNHLDFPVCVWASHRIGAMVATMSPALSADELVTQLKIAKPSVLVAHSDNLNVAAEAADRLGLHHSCIIVLDILRGQLVGDFSYKSVAELIQKGRSYAPVTSFRLSTGEAKKKIALLCFSSGTTGTPKAVSISHYNVICNIMQTSTFNRVNETYTSWEDRRFRSGDVCTAVLPFYHIYGLVTNLHFVIYAAMTAVVCQKFKFETMLRSISQYNITHLMIVPPQVVLFCKHPAMKNFDLSSVRYCMVAAAPMTAELTEKFLEVLPGIQLGQGYGMTEACAAVSMFPTSQKIGTLGSGGQLVSGTVAKVIKVDGSLAGFGEAGELHIKGGQVALGYYGNEKATKESFYDGWYRTGDEVVFRENGDIFITDRIKELIKVKGFQVAPAELEGHLLNHPQVADVCVIGVADEFSGEVPLAFIVLQPDIAAAMRDGRLHSSQIRSSIFEHVSSVKSKYKWLTGGIVFVDSIPKSASGKILRRVLRENVETLRHSLPSRL